MRRRFILFWALALGGCTSAESPVSCPSSNPVQCGAGSDGWCCPGDDTCGASKLECESSHPCPSTSPVLCNPGEPLAFCCSTGTRCKPSLGSYLCEPSVGSGASGGAGNSVGGGPGSVGGNAGAGVVDCPDPCGDTCCNSDSKCIFDDNTSTCRLRCTTSSQCPTDAPCCGETAGACRPPNKDLECLCTTGSECASGSCAPSTLGSLSNLPGISGKYACKDNDGKPYDGCNGLTFCDAGSCCFADTRGNEFCALPCTSNAQCGPDSVCDQYDASHTSCAGNLGCGIP